MRKNKQSFRSLVSFLMAWSFIVLTVTGLVLYVVPQGRIAHWVLWDLAGLEKDQWGWVHMMFGGVFIVTGVIHFVLNWKPLKKYFADRVKGHMEVKREVFIATALTVVIFALSAMNVPPASWVIQLNEDIKMSWITSPEVAPPFGHAEELSLTALTRRMNIDLDAAMQELKARKIDFTGKGDSLAAIALRNDTTPMEIYGLIKGFERKVAVTEKKLTAEDLDVQFAGTGLGRKTMAEICNIAHQEVEPCLDKLMDNDITTHEEEKAKAVSDRNEITPIDLLKILMLQEDG